MYTLVAEIDQADLPSIRRAGEAIVLVKNIGAGAAVAWTTQPSPLQNNLFQWGSGYALFVTTVGDQVGATIQMNSLTNAEGGLKYVLEPSLTFSSGQIDPELGPNQYRVDNRVPPSPPFGDLSFGLAQAPDGGTLTPLNSLYVPSMQSLTLNASDNVTIWLQSGVEPGQIVAIPPPAGAVRNSSIRSNSLVVKFGGGTTQQTVKYSSKLGAFELV